MHLNKFENGSIAEIIAFSAQTVNSLQSHDSNDVFLSPYFGFSNSQIHLREFQNIENRSCVYITQHSRENGLYGM